MTRTNNFPQLHVPSSPVENVLGHPFAILTWFKAGNSLAGMPYRDLIQDYDNLSNIGRQYARRTLEEMFSDDEFAALKRYIHESHRWPILKGVVPMPFHPYRGVGSAKKVVVPYSIQANREGAQVYRLNDEVGYDLGIDVHGLVIAPP